MTLTLPWRSAGKHTVEARLRRTQRHLAEVQADNAWLLAVKAAADDYFARLVADRDDVYDAYQQMANRVIDSELVASHAQSDLETANADRERLATEVTALQAQIANLTAIRPLGHHAFDPEATLPTGIAVKPPWEAYQQYGPVIPVPAHTAGTSPAWSAPDADVVQLPVLADRLTQGRQS